MTTARRVRTMVLKAVGITCAGCAEDMEKVLRKTEGILEASVDYTEGSIRLTYDPDRLDQKQVFSTARRMVRGLTVVADDESK